MGLKQAGQSDRWHLRPSKPGLHRQRPESSHCPDSEPWTSQSQAAPQNKSKQLLITFNSFTFPEFLVPNEHQSAVLTFAGVGDSAAVETSHTGLAAPSARVVQTLQTFAAAAVAAPGHADVDVSVTLAGRAESQPVAPRSFSEETFLTDVTART